MNAVAALLVLAISASPVSYRIELKGGGAYVSAAKPDERSGRYVFRTPEGTLMSVRTSDVARIRAAAHPEAPRGTQSLGPTSPATAARNQRVVADRLRDARRRKPGDLFRQDPYRPGVGVPYPPSANDYRVGRTFAYPPSGRVYEGPPPTNVPEGPPPKLEPPPPNR